MKRVFAWGIILIIISICGFVLIYSNILANRCEYEDCKNRKTGYFCCDEHTCHYGNCGLPVYDDNTTIKRNGVTYRNSYMYCWGHMCGESKSVDGWLSCDNPVIEGGRYCKKHNCIFEGCDRRKLDKTDYCDWHQDEK